MWVARDKDEQIYLYNAEPKKDILERFFLTTDYCGSVCLGNSLFPELTFENSPQEVELKIKEK